MARKNTSLLDELAALPWWVGAGLAAATWVFLKFGLPLITFQNPLFKGMALALPGLAWLFAGILLLPAFVSALHGRRKRKLLERQAGIRSLNAISWREFEELVGEACRRKGYRVTETGGGGADGGIDLILKKGGETVLVQCKQWKTLKIGVKVVRELYGVVMAEGADRGILICSGTYTGEARAFARGKPLELIAGPELVRLIDTVRKTPAPVGALPQAPPATLCPDCGSDMVLRTARRGAKAGEQFWGCMRFPRCRGVRPAPACPGT